MVSYLYRFEDCYYSVAGEDGDHTNIQVHLRRYKVIKHTPKGYWIEIPFCEKKWVSDSTRKRFAYPTKEQASNNFIKRKECQIRLLQNRIDRANRALYLHKL